jgi:hypothetical protein
MGVRKKVVDMTRPLCSVVLATFNRAKYLIRSLECYHRQDFDNDRFELVVIDDHSTDGTRELVLAWSATTKIKTTLLTASPKPTAWRDCGAILNAGIRAASGEHILLTHPEVMPGRKSVAACVEQLRDFRYYQVEKERCKEPVPLGLYACCPVYYLSPQDQSRIDSVPWDRYGAGAIRDIEGFYTDDTNGHPDYRHDVTDKIGTEGFRIQKWESFVFAGHSRETWKRLGGLMETSRWGAVDCAWMMRRHALKIPNHTCLGPDCIVIHQNHSMPGDVPTERSEQGWREELKGINWNDKSKLTYPAVDFLGW